MRGIFIAGRLVIGFALLSATTWLIAGDAPKKDRAADVLERMEGKWQVREYRIGEYRFRGAIVSKLRVIIAKKKFKLKPDIVMSMEKRTSLTNVEFHDGFEAELSIDPSTNPASFDLKHRGGGKRDGKAGSQPGIYKFDRNKLIICLSYSGIRPKGFDEEKASKGRMLVLERKEK